MKHIIPMLTLLLALLSNRCSGQSYQLTDLGAVIGTNSYAQGINNQGQVVGYWETASGAHAFLYQAGMVTDLGLLGGTNNYALSINNVGQVVGFAETTNGFRAFLYQNGAITNLGRLGGTGSYAFGINGSGQIVGHIDTPEGARAILYDSGSVINIGTLGGTNSFAFGINNALQVAGSSLTANNTVTHAFLWQSGTIIDLNQLQPDDSGWLLTDAHGINDLGNIAGWGVINSQEHAFLISDIGRATDLGVLLGGTNSYALGLNNSNQIVGASSTAAGDHAVIWQSRVINDLNNLIGASGWELKEACGINDLGQIVGWGIVNGQKHAFLLNPVPLEQLSVKGTGKMFVSPSGSFSPLINTLTVSITNPVNNASFAAPTNLTINATATDSGGTVTQVQFLIGTRILGVKTNSPYSVTWSNVSVGIHALSAIATDNSGLTATSSVVSISISTNLLPIADAHVRDGSYTNVNFGTNIVMECLTTNGSGNNRDIYFKFDLTGVSNISSAKLSVFAKLGGSSSVSNTVYSVTDTNWAETGIKWTNKPVRVTALATNSVTGTNWYLFDVSSYVKSQKNAGSNIVSLALHDPTNCSRLISINSKENTTNKPALMIVTTNSPLSVSLTSPINNALFAAPTNITINASAADSDGAVTQVQFFQGTTSLGIVTNAPYNLTWSNVTSGAYALTAVARDNGGVVATSRVVNVMVDIPPSVTLTNPAGNTVLVAGANIALGASASDADGNVTRVQFFRGTNSVGFVTNSPYTLVWTNPASGAYFLTAVATDNNSLTATSSIVSVIVDIPPSVTLTNPASNSVLVAGSNIALGANVSDADGTVAQVQFFQGNSSLGLKTNAPYGVVWTNPVSGTYVLTARATDNNGLTTTSAVVNVVVDIPPSVTLTNPASNTVFVAGSNIALGASAADADGVVSQVQFFQGTNSLGKATNSPYGLVWTNPAGGAYSLTARATDNNGLVSTSSVVNITVRVPPTVSITNPVNNASFAAPTNLTINATATDSGGTVTQVQFLVGTRILGVRTNNPCSFVWTNAPVGMHALSAIATDNTGLTATSSVVSISISTNLLPIADAHVRDGSYTNVNFGTNIVMECLTTNGSGNNRDIYFKFDLTGVSNISSAKLSVFAKLGGSGSVSNTVYSVTDTNWAETGIKWTNKPVRVTALATNSVTGTNWYLFDVSSYVKSQKNAGSNIVSLALHDPTNCSRLISINSKENTTNKPALMIVTTNSPLSVSLTSPINNALFAAPANISIGATAADSDGAVTQVQFFQGTTSLGIVTNAPYNLTWSNVTSGAYALTAVARDNGGVVATSRVVNVMVDIPPSVTLVSPTNNTVLIAGSMIALWASASDADGTIKQVQFFQGATSLGVVTNNPYILCCNAIEVGTNALTAQAMDNSGLVATSAPVNLIVKTPILGMMAWWRAEGNAFDSIGANNGILQGGANFAGGVVGQAFSFNGTSAYVSVPNSQALNPGNAITVECWLYRQAVIGSWDPVIKKIGPAISGYSLEFSGNNIMFWIGNNGWSSSSGGSIQLNQWYHVAGVYDGTNLLCYVNGQMVGPAVATSDSITPSSNPLCIASDPGDPGRFFAGLVDEVSIYNRALSSNEIEAIYNAGSAGKSSAAMFLNVTLTNPVNNALYLAKSTISLSANVSDTVGTVNQVQFFQGTNTLGIITNPPYNFTWSNATSGTYALTADAVDNYGFTATSGVVNVVVDIPPSVTFTNPLGNTVLVAGSNISLGASASDADGTVSQVQFFRGTNSLGVVTNSPYILVYKAADVGTNILTAQAMDNDGIVTTSAPVDLIVKTPILGITAWWQAEGNTLDSIGTNNGTLQGGAIYTNGMVGQAFSFDGNSGGMSVGGVGGLTTGNTPNTIEGWVKITGLPSSRSWLLLLGPETIGSEHWLLLPDGTAQLGRWGGPVVSPKLPVGTWAHLALTYDGSTLICYTNGVLQSSQALNFGFDSFPLTLGLPHIGDQAFNGLMDEVSIYNRALSPDEIAAIYNAGCAGKSSLPFNVTLTNPVDNALFPPGSSINVSANVSDNLGTVTQVQLFQGTNSLGTFTNAPYSLVWSNMMSGIYALTAVAVDNCGFAATSQVVNVIVDIPPGVMLTNPVNNSVIPAGPISLVASASDADGVIAQVQFFQGTTSLGMATTAPYNLIWVSPPAGAYSLTAQATDDYGLISTSSPVNVTVEIPPTVSITSPAANTIIISAQTNLTLTATAGDSDGTVVQIQFFQGTTSLGIVANAPYNLVWSNVTAGVYALTACATDNDGLTTTSVVVDLIVTPISISITNPANNAVFVASQTNLTVMATAGDIAGTVTQVQFFQGSTSLGFATTSPYSVVWSDALTGMYALTAVATDNNGLTATSPVVNLTITPLFATNTLSLWLKADAITGLTNYASVSTWSDSSGSGNDATQITANNQPLYVANTINNFPVVRFDGIDDYFSLPYFMNGATQGEALVVLKATTPQGGHGSLWTLGNSSLVIGSSVYAPTGYPDYDGVSISDNFGSTDLYFMGFPVQPLNQYNVYEVLSETNHWAAWINGISQYQTNNNTVSFGSQALSLGADPRVISYGWVFKGDIAEVLVFKRVLTADERTTVSTYLNGKYGLVPAVPAAPTNLVATAISTSQISLTWDKTLNGGATQISIERSTESSGGFAVVAQVADALSYVDTNLAAGTTYYYQVRAINWTQWSPYSNETNATTLSSGPDMPLGNLALWLKADAGLAQGSTNMAVSYWADQSGNGNNAQQMTGGNQPVWVPNALNGFPAVRYNGGQYLYLPNFLTPLTQAEAFVVVKTMPGGYSNPSLWFLGGSGSAYDEAYPLWDGSIHENFGSTASYNLGVPAQPFTQYQMYEVAAETNNWAAWITGVRLYQRTSNTVAFSSSPTLSGSYNPVGYGPPTFFNGDMAEILIFERVLTANERATVNGYLGGKYGLAPAVQVTPTNLVATAISPTQIGLTWNEVCNGGITQIAIKRSTASNGVYQVVAQMTNAASYMDTNLTGGATYYYQVQAINWPVPYDFTQWSPDSNVAQATTPTNGMDLPLESLALWLKADTGLVPGSANTLVNLWADQSGNGNNAIQSVVVNQPVWVPGVIGDRPVVQFNGGQYLNLPNFLAPLAQGEVFVVLRADSDMPASNRGAMRLGPNGDEYPATNGMIIEDFGSMSAHSLVKPLQPLNQYNLYNIQADANNWAAELNGTTLLATTNDEFEVASQPTLGSSICPFAGGMAEIMIFNRTLTAGERASVENYLNQRYSLVTTPPLAPSLTISTNLDGSVTLGWVGVTNATGYLVERALGTNGAFGVIATLPYGTETDYTDVNVSSGLAYVYRIQAINWIGISVPSNQAQRPLASQGTVQDDMLKDYLEGIDPTAGTGGVNPAVINLMLYTPLK